MSGLVDGPRSGPRARRESAGIPSPAGPTGGEAVVGVFDRSDLGQALAATHRAGFGPNARVLDGDRGDLAGQLRRAGLVVPLDADRGASTVLIVIVAPGRAAAAHDVLSRAGARAVHEGARAVAPSPPVGEPDPLILPAEPVDDGATAAV